MPTHPTLATAKAAAAGCKGCDLWRRATQTVFGSGPSKATVVLVGEQPGNDEDLAGQPFVGPAGRVLDRALSEAGLERSTVYVTNVVKHFSWEPRGKRRIHKKPRESTLAPIVMTTVHPSSILRARTDGERAAAMNAFVKDLKALVARL